MDYAGKERRMPDRTSRVVYSQAGGWASNQAGLVDINPAPDASAPASPSGQYRCVTIEVGVRA